MKKASDTPAPGTTIGGYRIERIEPLEHIGATYYELTHQPTGARHIHIASGDDNNFFGVFFPTVPEDSTGVAHILEHVVLEGSERFPVHRMFDSMMARSLKTFMNASTSGDATSYYYSTRNEKDFYNLLAVYLDAVFFPRIAELSFKQEGHRLEFDNSEDPSTPLQFKGVVFNEMKGRQGTPTLVLADSVLGKALYPDLTYAHNSGGDPERIPDLTWKDLKDFHARHYHPSNSYFFTYGNLPLTRTLNKIEDEFLSRFDRIEVDTTIPDQKRFSSPKEFRAFYPLAEHEDPSKKGQVLIAWPTTHLGNSFEVFCFKVLEWVLLAHAAAPLHKALIDSQLGDTLTDIGGFIDWFREAVFCAGLKGVDPEDAGKVEALVIETLDRAAREGIDPKEVDAAIHQLEIQSREVSNAPHPFPMKLFGQLGGAYMYGGDPFRSLQFDEDLALLQAERSSGPFFENLIRKHLLENPHRVRIVLAPDQRMEEQAAETERARLDAIRERLTPEVAAKIVEDALTLKKQQEAKQDLSVLPTLEVTDIPMQFEDVPHSIEVIGGARVGFFPQPTNGLTYVDIRASFAGLPDHLKDRLSLFAYAVVRSGAAGDDYLQLATRINSYTGGVDAGPGIRPLARGTGEFLQNFTVSGKALARNHEPFMAILKDLLSGASFEPKRLKDLVAEYRANKESSVTLAGHQYALGLARSHLTAPSQFAERLGGLSQLRVLKELSAFHEDALDPVIEDLHAIRDHLFRNAGLEICVTAEEKHFSEIRKLLEEILTALPDAAISGDDRAASEPIITHQARTTAVPVAFNAKAYKTVGLIHPDAPALMVLAKLLDSKFLHREIREKGGAYGAAAVTDREEGSFAFVTYRDPHVVRSFRTFDEAVRFAIESEIDPVDLKEAILESCRDVDPLLSPDTKGRLRFFSDLTGYTLDLKARFKQGLLEVSAKDLERVAATYLVGGEAAMAVISNPDKIREANEEMGGIFEVSAI